jgi:xanthine dehydrogenase small subunit
MTSKLRFIFGGQIREIHNIDPQTSVLNWLRYEERKTGTKEGCAEGDCGACTVVIRELTSSGITYRAINACILFMPMLDGKELLTVEDLKSAHRRPHIIQEKMTELHGSQCGFCTPGIVMSLYAAHQNGEPLDTQGANDILAGNLCRCTGYGPILEAAKEVSKQTAAKDDYNVIRKRLESIQRNETLSMTFWSPDGSSRTYVSPVSVAEFASLYKLYSSATIIAGGTDVGLWITKQGRTLDNIIYLGDVADCKSIAETEAGLKIDAGVSYSSALARLG